MNKLKVSDETIREYCKIMGYTLMNIGKIGFSYQKPDGSHAALLKSAATYRRTEEPPE